MRGLMRILLNIGNTHTQAAMATGEELGPITTWDSRHLLSALPQLLTQCEPQGKVLAACVVPQLRQKLQERLGERIAFVTCESYPHLDFSRYDRQALGGDRIANIAAAAAWSDGAPVLVLDCGSAITSEAITGEGIFQGGVILPGRTMQRRALATFTAQLPEIPTDAEMPPGCGKNTAQAIKAGVDWGALGAVKEIIAQTQKLSEFSDCKVLIIGGDAQFFTQNIPGSIAGPEDFTLQGVQLAQM